MSHARARELQVGVRGVGIGGDSALVEELDHISPPDPEHRPHVSAAARGHAAQTRQTTSPHQVHDGAFDHVVGRVGKRDSISGDSCSRMLEELVAQGARAGLDGAPGHGRHATLDHELHTQPGAQLSDLACDLVRACSQRVVEMRPGEVEAELPHGDQESGRIGPARNSDKYSVFRRDELA